MEKKKFGRKKNTHPLCNTKSTIKHRVPDAPGPESIDLMVPDSNAHFREMMNSKSSDETKETN